MLKLCQLMLAILVVSQNSDGDYVGKLLPSLIIIRYVKIYFEQTETKTITTEVLFIMAIKYIMCKSVAFSVQKLIYYMFKIIRYIPNTLKHNMSMKVDVIPVLLQLKHLHCNVFTYKQQNINSNRFLHGNSIQV